MDCENRKCTQKEETLKLRKKYIGSSCALFFEKDPMKIVRGKGQFLYDEHGQKYLDCINNVAHVGHCHPRVVEACHDEMGRLCTNNRYLHDNIVQLAERIANTLPGDLSVCFFTNSGSEANDLALRLAKYYTKSDQVIALNHGYHGHTGSLIAISSYKHNHPGAIQALEGRPDKVHIVPAPDTYRGKYRDTEHSLNELASLYATEVRDVCNKITSRGGKVGAFIAETLQSCGGQLIPPPGYFSAVYEYVRAAGGVCIADEVQTGFGRVGSHWWAFELDSESIQPDIVTLGKPMGNGHPIAAVVTTPAVAAAFRTGPDYFNTFGGNSVSCAVAMAVMNVIEDEHLREAAEKRGNLLRDSLRTLAVRHALIGDVRGAGMFAGVDLVLDRNTREPAVRQAEWILWRLRDEHHIIMSLDGPHNNVLKFKPPMVLNEQDIGGLVSALDSVLTQVELKFGLIQTKEADRTDAVAGGLVTGTESSHS